MGGGRRRKRKRREGKVMGLKGNMGIRLSGYRCVGGERGKRKRKRGRGGGHGTQRQHGG